MNGILKELYLNGIVPVIKIEDPEQAEPLAEALVRGGLACAEVTFRTTAAKEAISRISKSRPDMLLGAGTVLTTAQADEAVEAGARFIVTPGFNPEVVRYCLDRGYPIVPGINNPSGIEQALSFGLDTVKFFPAEQSGGIAKIKAMSAPFPMVKVMPTGGISLKNLKDYISCRAVCACGGSYMVTADLIENGRWDEITDLCRRSVEAVKEARA
jgi:2-dehydro-3-deoxyphosphogluconate aldolase/(4S)-4-hydroxy-2-oxoglutarate aldolase